MTDLQKLRYDLAMNCALVETLTEYQQDPKMNLHDAMWKNFQLHYETYALFGAENDMKQFMKDLLDERLIINPSASVGKADR